MANATKDLLEKAKEKMNEIKNKEGQENVVPKTQAELMFERMFKKGGDDDGDIKTMVRDVVAMVTNVTLAKSIPKILANSLSDDDPAQHRYSSEIADLSARFDRIERELREQREREQQKQMFMDMMKPVVDRLENIERRYTPDEIKHNKRDEIQEIRSSIEDLGKAFNKQLSAIDEKKKNEELNNIKTSISDLEDRIAQQMSSLSNLITVTERERRPNQTQTGGIKEALAQLREEKKLMEELGMIKKDIDSGKASEDILKTLNETIQRVPELIESGKTIYDMIKGNTEDIDEDDDIPPYENSDLNSTPVLERKAVEIPTDLRIYLQKGKEVKDPADPNRLIWVDEWGNGYTSQSTGKYMTKKELELQMKLKPQDIRENMRKSKEYYMERIREEQRIKEETHKDEPEDEQENEPEEEETGTFSPEEGQSEETEDTDEEE